MTAGRAAGHALVECLKGTGFPVTAAFWFWEEELREESLVIVTPLANESSRGAYTRVPVLSAGRVPTSASRGLKGRGLTPGLHTRSAHSSARDSATAPLVTAVVWWALPLPRHRTCLTGAGPGTSRGPDKEDAMGLFEGLQGLLGGRQGAQQPQQQQDYQDFVRR